jgi:hypothetical protein
MWSEAAFSALGDVGARRSDCPFDIEPLFKMGLLSLCNRSIGGLSSGPSSYAEKNGEVSRDVSREGSCDSISSKRTEALAALSCLPTLSGSPKIPLLLGVFVAARK